MILQGGGRVFFVLSWGRGGFFCGGASPPTPPEHGTPCSEFWWVGVGGLLQVDRCIYLDLNCYIKVRDGQ